MTWHGMAWYDMTWHDMTWHDVICYMKSRSATWHNLHAYHTYAWRGVARSDVTWHDKILQQHSVNDIYIEREIHVHTYTCMYVYMYVYIYIYTRSLRSRRRGWPICFLPVCSSLSHLPTGVRDTPGSCHKTGEIRELNPCQSLNLMGGVTRCKGKSSNFSTRGFLLRECLLCESGA